MDPTYPDPFRRWMITLFVMTGSFMSQLDVTIANVALPYMQGTTSASSEQITWVLTSYIVTAAIFTPLTGWLASRHGRKRVMIASIAGFTVASLLCGVAANLPQMIGFRILQGMMGSALLPISQAVLLDINPPNRHGQAMAIWGSGTVLGPIVGPLIGGWLTDNLTWRWVFFINVPVGIAAVTGLVLFMRHRVQDQPGRLDMLGFVLLGLTVGCFQLVLDRGQMLDWFSSSEIWIEAALGVTGLYLFVVHSLTARNPFVKLQLFADSNYVIGSVLALFVAVGIFSVLSLLPPLLNGLMGYSAQQVGLETFPRGIGAMIAMQLTAPLMTRIDPRLIVLGGLAMSMAAVMMMAGISLQMDGRLFIMAGVMQGIGSGAMFVPLSTLAFSTLPPHLRNEGAALSTLIRNMGASMGISVLQALTIRNTARVHSYLVEQVRPDNPVLGWSLDGFDTGATGAMITLNREITRQATMMAYVESFSALALLSLLFAPLILFLRTGRKRAP